MISPVNRRQKDFYESRFSAHGGEEEAANWITNRWRSMRRRLTSADKRIGVRNVTIERHKKWLGDLSQKVVLDLGCFSGNDLSLYLAEHAKCYVGIDLSESAISVLNERLKSNPSATAIAGDFLDADFKFGEFDAIYAHAVLHHFPDFEGLCKRLRFVLSDNGIVVSQDPLQTGPLNRLARAFYRPFQSDKDWEWPFTRKTFQILLRNFWIEEIRGDRGLSKIGAVFPPLANWGMRMDRKYANRISIYLYLCWRVTMKLRKR